MGIQTEFNPELALRDFSEFKKRNRQKAECVPPKLKKGGIYKFLKEGQRHYYLTGKIPLIKTKGNELLSRPLAIIRILETTHFLLKGKVYTKGLYKIEKVITDNKIYFECFNLIESKKNE